MMNWTPRGAMGSLTSLGLAVLLASVPPAQASPVTYDFEGFANEMPLTTQIAGLTFSHSMVLTSGLSLNEVDFPPRSGFNAVIDDGGAVTIDFLTPVFSVGAYFTYASPLTFSAYDSSNTLLGSVLAAYTSNTGTGGDPGSSPNEFLSFANASGLIARVTVTGAATGNSFVFDDLVVDRGDNTVPEPATIALVATLLAVGSGRGGWLRRRNQTKT